MDGKKRDLETGGPAWRRWQLAFALLCALAAALVGCVRGSPKLPTFVASTPVHGATVARSVWPVLQFASAVPARSAGRARIECSGLPITRGTHVLDDGTLVLNPDGMLPAAASCDIIMTTVDGTVVVSFQTAAAGSTFEPVYDRRDRNQPLPFPDDYFTDPDPSRPTGLKLALVAPDHTSLVKGLLDAMAFVTDVEGGDGFSPIGLIGVQLSAAPDTSTLPLDAEASLDPLASVALVDMTPGSPTHEQRIPFVLTPRSDVIGTLPTVHSLVIFPSVPLTPMGQYALVVTNRALDLGGEPLARSAFFDLALGAPIGGEAAEITRARPLAQEVTEVASMLMPVPIPADDVALAVRMTMRSLDFLPDDVLDLRQDVLNAPVNFTIGPVTPVTGDVAAIVEGTFDVPDWRGASSFFLNRDAGGLPQPVGTLTIPFIMALPREAETLGHAPITMYQHGNPGSAQGEVPNAAAGFLAGDGLAVAGFTDVLNRDYATTDDQQLAIFAVVLFTGDVPDFYMQTYAEQMAFVRVLKSMDTLDLLPVGSPDGVPDLDPSFLTYEGISYGSNHGQAFLAYEPGIEAGALVAGAVRLAELLEYQDRTRPLGGPPFLTETLPGFLPGARMPDIWMGLSLFATVYDAQDPHNHARHIYRHPLNVDGTTQRASILAIEGIGDSFTKNNATRSLAWQLGIPQLTPAAVPVSTLASQAGPIQGNVDSQTTGALVQFVPDGVGLPVTPGCVGQFEGHYCAQSAPGSRAMRSAFYRTAVEQSAPIIEFQP